MRRLKDHFTRKRPTGTALVDPSENERQGGRFPPGSRGDRDSRTPDGSFLVAETGTMERRRREDEQAGMRRIARVNAREHPETEPQSAPEGELENSILQHPWLDSQHFDGADRNLNVAPPLNSKARREFDNAKREQDKEKQNRLEQQLNLDLTNTPRYSSTPTPRPK